MQSKESLYNQITSSNKSDKKISVIPPNILADNYTSKDSKMPSQVNKPIAPQLRQIPNETTAGKSFLIYKVPQKWVYSQQLYYNEQVNSTTANNE